MDLTPEELRELATFFAKRLSPDLDLVDATAPVSPDRVTAWMSSLEAAQRSGRLAALARKIAAADRASEAPDRDLQEACRLLAGGGGGGSLALGAIVAAGAAVTLVAVTGAGLFLLVAGLAGAPDRSEPVALQPQSITEDEPVVARADPPAAEPEVAPVEVAEVEPAEVEPAEVASLEVEPEHRLTDVSERCGLGDGVVGYWYAGEAPPGAAGDVVVLEHAVNVRVDYPDRDNGYDARAPVRCVLEAGDRVRLSRDPIPVPRDRWWVPLEGDDLLSRRTG